MIESRREFLKRFLVANQPTYSSTLRELNKSNPEKVIPFMKTFKEAFDQAELEKLENPEHVALMETFMKILPEQYAC